MNDSADKSLLALFSSMADGTLSESDARLLDDRLKNDSKARAAYFEFVHLETQLGFLLSAEDSLLRDAIVDLGPPPDLDHRHADGSLHDAMILPAMKEERDPAPVPAKEFEWNLPPKKQYEKPVLGTARKVWFYAVAACLLLCAGLAVWAFMAQAPIRHSDTPAVKTTKPLPEFATLVREVDARWAGSIGVETSHGVPAKELQLESGWIEIVWTNGVHAVVAGPARFSVDGPNRMKLLAGSAAVRVTPSGTGFLVETPGAIVTDVGTEFGVRLGGAGETEVHVFKGVVRAASGNSSATLTTGDAARVLSGRVTPLPGRAVIQGFTRTLDTSVPHLDLADLFSGGDGTMGLRLHALDSLGKSGQLEPVGIVEGMREYVRAVGVPVIDGCLVPDGTGGAQQTDSLGHRYQFPSTNHQAFNHIWSGGTPPMDPKYEPLLTVLSGVDYATKGHGLIFTSGNRAVTFDLRVIRNLWPGRVIIGFHAVVGNTDVRPRRPTLKADAYVLVDGEARFVRKGFAPADGAIEISVPIQPNDQFLTLAATDGGDGIAFDGVIWGDPTLDVTGNK